MGKAQCGDGCHSIECWLLPDHFGNGELDQVPALEMLGIIYATLSAIMTWEPWLLFCCHLETAQAIQQKGARKQTDRRQNVNAQHDSLVLDVNSIGQLTTSTIRNR